jgi:hypothetical protein
MSLHLNFLEVGLGMAKLGTVKQTSYSSFAYRWLPVLSVRRAEWAIPNSTMPLISIQNNENKKQHPTLSTNQQESLDGWRLAGGWWEGRRSEVEVGGGRWSVGGCGWILQ